MRPAVTVNHNILNNLSQARIINQAAIAGGTSMGIPNLMAVRMSNMISSGRASTILVAQILISFGQSVIPSMTMSTTSTVPGSFASAANVGLTQQSTGALQSAQSKYVKVWEGYRSASASESKLATNNANSATYMSRSHEQKEVFNYKIVACPDRHRKFENELASTMDVALGILIACFNIPELKEQLRIIIKPTPCVGVGPLCNAQQLKLMEERNMKPLDLNLAALSARDLELNLAKSLLSEMGQYTTVYPYNQLFGALVLKNYEGKMQLYLVGI
ncbi:unnamed protein product [Lactuca saligna]|uniref:Uncharacterized protein n=1 Tax=Lactuca saligna TaxID=75948 RepID=A0AA35VPA6_LACSI|nr:unnamed protein product [Lactuca saligna]